MDSPNDSEGSTSNGASSEAMRVSAFAAVAASAASCAAQWRVIWTYSTLRAMRSAELAVADFGELGLAWSVQNTAYDLLLAEIK